MYTQRLIESTLIAQSFTPFPKSGDTAKAIALSFQAFLQQSKRVYRVYCTYNTVGCTPLLRCKADRFLSTGNKQKQDD